MAVVLVRPKFLDNVAKIARLCGEFGHDLWMIMPQVNVYDIQLSPKGKPREPRELRMYSKPKLASCWDDILQSQNWETKMYFEADSSLKPLSVDINERRFPTYKTLLVFGPEDGQLTRTEIHSLGTAYGYYIDNDYDVPHMSLPTAVAVALWWQSFSPRLDYCE